LLIMRTATQFFEAMRMQYVNFIIRNLSEGEVVIQEGGWFMT
jgi:hypothetical protein